MVIETERLILRSFLESDAADVFEYLIEPMVNCFACMKLNSLEEAKADWYREQTRKLALENDRLATESSLNE